VGRVSMGAATAGSFRRPVGGGGFALGAATYHDERAEAKGPEVSARVAATPSPTVTRSAYPYGRQVGLREGLTPGSASTPTGRTGSSGGGPG
jgi:hypothetical protein